MPGTTTVAIDGERFLINGQPTYAGRSFRDRSIEGLLMNVRAVQATFDDQNPETRDRWAYPDGSTWDPERNLSDFLAVLPSWREYGLLAVTVNFQGGSPEGYSKQHASPESPYGRSYSHSRSRLASLESQLTSEYDAFALASGRTGAASSACRRR